MKDFCASFLSNKGGVIVLLFGLITGGVLIGASIAQDPTMNAYAQNTTASQNTTNQIENTTTTSTPLVRNVSALLEPIIENARGDFTSLQNDTDSKEWIATGKWDLFAEPSETNRSNYDVAFNATINMKGTDNSGGHQHMISEFKLLNKSIESSNDGSVIVFNGTGSVETDVGLYTDVPMSITIHDAGPAIITVDTQTNEIQSQWIPRGGTIALLIDQRVEDHFGSTPVFGDVKRE
jgi:hypothetical protein